jgi:hypothetical protein
VTRADLEFLRMNCETTGCQNQIAFRVFWPGHTVNLCGQHCANAVLVASARGFDLDFRVFTLADVERAS